jgi:quercetin dioxygenase-like cupin family protein
VKFIILADKGSPCCSLGGDMITQIPSVAHSALPGVEVFPISGHVEKGVAQQVLVKVEDGGSIPLHTHTVMAKMVVTSGEARILSGDKSIDGTIVRQGSVVTFDPIIPHGFADCRGFTFLSDNGGIVGHGEDWDMEMFH